MLEYEKHIYKFDQNDDVKLSLCGKIIKENWHFKNIKH
jgi:hypothetical protein